MTGNGKQGEKREFKTGKSKKGGWEGREDLTDKGGKGGLNNERGGREERIWLTGRFNHEMMERSKRDG